MGWKELYELGQDSYGRLHVGAATDADLTEKEFRGAAVRRRYGRPHRAVITLPGAPDSPEGRIAAALATVEPPVLASHWTAAWLHGLVPSPPTTIEVLVPHGRRARRRDQVQVHRSRTLAAHHETVLRGLAATSGGRTLADLSGEAAISTLRAWAIDLCQRGESNWDEMAAVTEEVGALRGINKLRLVVAQCTAENPESILDYQLRRRFRMAGLPPDRGPVAASFPGRTLHIDIAWARYMVGVEADSLTYHGDRASLQRDIRRHNRTRPTDWIIFRAGWAEVDDDEAFAELLTLVTRALRQRGAPV